MHISTWNIFIKPLLITYNISYTDNQHRIKWKMTKTQFITAFRMEPYKEDAAWRYELQQFVFYYTKKTMLMRIRSVMLKKRKIDNRLFGRDLLNESF